MPLDIFHPTLSDIDSKAVSTVEALNSNGFESVSHRHKVVIGLWGVA